MITLSRPGTEMTALPSSAAHAPGSAFNEFSSSSSCCGAPFEVATRTDRCPSNTVCSGTGNDRSVLVVSAAPSKVSVWPSPRSPSDKVGASIAAPPGGASGGSA
jgi:hypothetical protein